MKAGTASPERLYIVDSIGPFFVKHPREVINWSRVPHDHLEKKGELPKKSRRLIRSNFERYVERVAGIGYTGISIDELSRLALADCYPPKLQRKIRRYRRYYRRLFVIARKHGLKVYVTSDVMFFNRWILAETGGRRDSVFQLLRAMLAELFLECPEIAGVILRIGESDGVDVRGNFRSQLVVRTAADARALLAQLLPLFEAAGRTLIFRTWTVGAYPIGDLMWNRRTYEAVFGGIDSPSLVISMKYGESDFFRYLELNRHFFLDGRRKLIELQARREYEGFGEYPAFVGREYARFRDNLEWNEARGLVGIHVWCQTGGWSRFRNFTFLKNTSYWNELNTHVTLKLFRDRCSVEEAVTSFLLASRTAAGRKSKSKARQASTGPGPVARMSRDLLRFLDLADQVVRELLYDPAFARHELYFRRVRVPPLLHIFWDSVTVNSLFAALHLAFVTPAAVRQSLLVAREALAKIDEMARLARRARFPFDHDFQRDTFRLLAFSREALYAGGLHPERKTGPEMVELRARFETLKERYERNYPGAYRFRVDWPNAPTGGIPAWASRRLSAFFRLVIRRQREYRPLDYALFNPLMGLVYSGLFYLLRDRFPSFLNQQGMPVEKLLR